MKARAEDKTQDHKEGNYIQNLSESELSCLHHSCPCKCRKQNHNSERAEDRPSKLQTQDYKEGHTESDWSKIIV